MTHVRMPLRSRGQLQPGALPASLCSAVDWWSEYADSKVCNVVKAISIVRFALRVDAETGHRVVEPRHYVIDFPTREQGRQKHHSALFSLRIVREEDLAKQTVARGAVANHLRFKPAAELKQFSGAEEYVEFELLSREHETPSQQPLRICMGPVRVNKHTGRREFVRVDMGQCIQTIATDIVEDPNKGERLVQNRWWMCIETLRLLCSADHIDCSALDKPDVPPQEWVIRLMDTHAPVNRREELKAQHEDRDIDDLMQFIDSRGGNNGHTTMASANATKVAKPKKKKSGKEKEEDQQSAAAVASVSDAASSNSVPCDCSTHVGSRAESPARPGGAAAGAAEEPELQGGGSLPPPSTKAAAAAPVSSLVSPKAAGPAACGEQPAGEAKAISPRGLDVDLMGELLDRYRRLQERSARAEVEAKVSVLRDLLEVLDELERADVEAEEDSAASRRLFAASQRLEAKFRGLGLTRVEAFGKPFDPQLHRLIGEALEPASEASLVVVEELMSGWVFGKEVVRPALVSLG